MVGYQHTSITPRHTTLLLAAGESSITPLPDYVVTVGDVTRRYLEEHGNYPPGLFLTGGALRQVWRDPVARLDPRNRPLRVLLALSSSRAELRDAVKLSKGLAEEGIEFELGVRPHPEFPVSTLPRDLQLWIQEYAQDLSGTPLHENIAWCDVTVYVSSTVALESLMLGKPAINLRLSDPIDPDPVLESDLVRLRASSPAELAAAFKSIVEMTDEEYARHRSYAIAYVRNYLRPFLEGYERKFLD